MKFIFQLAWDSGDNSNMYEITLKCNINDNCQQDEQLQIEAGSVALEFIFFMGA